MCYAYRKNPHSDSRETAVKAASILNDLFIDPNVEQIHLRYKYILPPTGVGTASDPMKTILEEALKIERKIQRSYVLMLWQGIHTQISRMWF